MRLKQDLQMQMQDFMAAMNNRKWRLQSHENLNWWMNMILLLVCSSVGVNSPLPSVDKIQEVETSVPQEVEYIREYNLLVDYIVVGVNSPLPKVL